jgi:hypothetical protein
MMRSCEKIEEMKKIFKGILLIGWLLLSFACEEESQQPIFIPTDLTIEVEVSNNGSGIVSVEAQAIGALNYHFFFGEEESEAPIQSAQGRAQYTYSKSGVYTIEVRAFGNSLEYTSVTEEIDILVDEENPGIPGTGYETPDNYEGMTLVWRDEFNGSALNTSDWTFEIGTGNNGWGNNELQYYRSDNTEVRDGHLIITARQETFGGRNYTSSRIITQGKQDFRYGRVDIRAVLPEGQGLWPALWMLGSSFSSVGWPSCGEIDIMELVGGETGDDQVYGTAHWEAGGSPAKFTGSYTLNSGKFSDEFHVFTIMWDDSSIRWYVDDVQYHVIDTSPAELDAFRDNFFFIFNVAVGGNWPGSPDATTRFPQRMIVDYVRIFQPE